MVIRPFGRWSTDHLTRVNHSHDELQAQVKAYDRQVEQCKKLRQNYYNKCRLLEDLEEETHLAFPAQNPTTEEKGKAKEGTPPIVVEEPPKSPPARKSPIEDDDWPLEIGDAFYSKDELSALMSRMIKEIPQKEVKVFFPKKGGRLIERSRFWERIKTVRRVPRLWIGSPRLWDR
jgi:hypothetical protein